MRVRQAASGRQTFFALSCATLSFAMAQTILFPALAQIERHFDTSTAGVTETISVFFLTGALSAALAGRLADMFGKRRILLLQLACFVAAAAVCSTAPSLAVLVVGRGMMGLSAGIFPLSASILRDLESGDRGQSIALLAGSIYVGAALGLVLGGVLADQLGYRWVFLTSLITGAGAFTAAARYVPELRPHRAPAIDTRGALLLAGTVTAPLIAIAQAPTWGWTSIPTLVLLTAGCLGLLGLVQLELRVLHPFVDVRLFGDRAIAPTNAATFAIGFATFGSSTIIALFVEEPRSTGYGLGASATEAGLFLLPAALLSVLAAPLAGRVTAAFGARTTLLAGTAGASTAVLLLAIGQHGRAELFLLPALMYVSNCFAMGAMPNLILDAAPSTRRTEATSINHLLRLLGSSLGVQLAGALIAGSTVAGIPSVNGYRAAFGVEAAFGVIAVGAAFLIPRKRPFTISVAHEYTA